MRCGILLLLVSFSANADYRLNTYDSETDRMIATESFIARSDCIKRAVKNSALATQLGKAVHAECVEEE